MLTLLLAIAALSILIACINHRFIGFQPMIFVLLVSLVFTSILKLLAPYNAFISEFLENILKLDFHYILLECMIGFLLFSGGLNVDLKQLKKDKVIIALLSIGSTSISMVIIACLVFYGQQLFNLPQMSFLLCLMLGAILSPTDPVSVIANLKQIKAPKSIQTIISGEAIFNDGFGLLFFVILYQLNFSNVDTCLSFIEVMKLFTLQSVGSVLVGFMLAHTLRKIITAIKGDDHMPVLVTVLGVALGIMTAKIFNLSVLLLLGTCSIFLSSSEGSHVISLKHKNQILFFWNIIDEVLNLFLFFLIGLEVVQYDSSVSIILFSVFMIAVAIISRYLSVIIPVQLLSSNGKNNDMVKILVWGGLRGGLAIAMALHIPVNEYSSIIVGSTYCVAIWTMLIQGSTMNSVLKNSKLCVK
jgi:monovalent cation:H+ antiporter, CPA1 family